MVGKRQTLGVRCGCSAEKAEHPSRQSAPAWASTLAAFQAPFIPVVSSSLAQNSLGIPSPTRHVRTAASSQTPGWRSRRWPERYSPRSRPAPASVSQSSASPLPYRRPVHTTYRGQLFTCGPDGKTGCLRCISRPTESCSNSWPLFFSAEEVARLDCNGWRLSIASDCVIIVRCKMPPMAMLCCTNWWHTVESSR
jgi:hypothetical protein